MVEEVEQCCPAARGPTEVIDVQELWLLARGLRSAGAVVAVGYTVFRVRKAAWFHNGHGPGEMLDKEG